MARKKSDTIGGIVVRNVFTYFNAIFALLAVVLILVGSYRSLTFLPVVIANIFIGIFQQVKAKLVLDKLALLAESKYLVTRGGQEIELPSSEIALGDFVLLGEGMQVPADGVLVEGELRVNEALLTGEADEVFKDIDDELLSGSFVVSGEGRVRMTAVGEDCYAERLTNQARQIKDHPSEMVGDIDRIVKCAGILIIPLGLALLGQGVYINHLSLQVSVEAMVSAVVGMIPEGLYLLVTIALALSAARLARNQVLLHDMRSTETLARVDVLCVDKTGTLTNDEMVVSAATLPQNAAVSMEEAKRQLADYDATVGGKNATARALRSFLVGGEAIAHAEVTPFTSVAKYSQLDCEGRSWRLGAPELSLAPEAFEQNRELIQEHASVGRRVLAFSHKTDAGYVPLLFVCLENDLRANVRETLAYLQEQEVRIMVISGDNPQTVSAVAASAGVNDADKWIDASDLGEGDELAAALEGVSVVGRVKPEQKKAIVEALHGQGVRVAMTGDGVNDILAMKEADCSIAMGNGSDAARQAAQAVLLDSDFAHMRQIISEGRRDINNITRSATLFLYKNLFSMLLALFSIVMLFSYPLKPNQVSLISMFNIGMPAFLLALEPNEEKQHGRFIRVTLIRALPAAITSFVCIAALVVYGNVFSIDMHEIAVVSTFLLSAVGFMVLFRICRPHNGYRVAVIVASVLGLVLTCAVMPGLFSIVKVSSRLIMLAVVFLFAEESILRNVTALVEKHISAE